MRLNAAAPDDRNAGLVALTDPLLEPLFWRAARIGAPSAWWPHVPFAHWIVTAGRPNVLVELGTHAGVSYSAFCQAVQSAGLPTRCHAVDTWLGDAHAGGYDETVFQEFSRFHDEHFGEFSTLIRRTFDEALDCIEDGAVDLLHIDGLHTFEAVRHDYDNWLPKLSDRAVVLFHDVNERAGDFGVWRLWQTLSAKHPSFSFLHGHGLGVLAVGERVPDAVLALCAIEDPRRVAAVRTRFARIGERWLAETREKMLAQRIDELSGARDAMLREASSARETAEAAVAEAMRQVEAAQAAEAKPREEAARVVEAEYERQAAEERAETPQAGEAQALGEAARRQEEAGQRAETEQAIKAAEQRAETEQAKAAEQRAEAEQAIKAAEQRAEAAQSSAARALRQASVAHDELLALRTALQNATGHAAAIALERDVVLSSTAWRATWPLRRAGQLMPPWVRRGFRGGAKLVWWTVTLELPAKLADRRRLLAAPQAAPAIEARQYTPSFPIIDIDVPVAITAEHPAPALTVPQSASSPATRLLYISGEHDTPGHTYRVERFVATAMQIGVQAAAMNVSEIATRREEIENTTLLVIWRARWTPELAEAVAIARRSGAHVVFDVDDLMIDPNLARIELIDGIRSQSLAENAVSGHFAEVRETMRSADLCFATTDDLAFHMRGRGKRTHVLPNGFDQTLYDIARRARRGWQRMKADSLIRIGYAGGSRTHQRDFAVAVEAIARLLREDARCRLVLFQTPDGTVPLIDIAEYPDLAGLDDRIEWRPLQPLADLPREVARFDINIAPLELGNPFCEAKSELKFWEAALVEVPTIASPTGPFRRAIAHGKTGFLAASADDWYYHLTRLAADPELRRRVARQAYHKALATFGPMQRALRFGRVIEQLQGGPAGARAFALETQLATAEWQPPKVFPSDLIFEQPGRGDAEVTVVIPLYNYENYVAETLDSVRQQTLTMLDLVIVDGCSTDDSLAVAKAWAEQNAPRFNRLVVIRNRANYGLAFCRNSGFDIADTTYVLPLDADNKLLPTCCETLLGAIHEAGTAFVYPSIQHFGDSSAVVNNVPYDPQGFIEGNYIDAMALIAKEAWAIIGGYHHVRHGWEDYDFWCRLAEIGLRGAWRPEVLAQYRVHKSSMMTKQTTVPENYRRLFEDFTDRHPWVVLGEQDTSRRPPSPNLHITAPEMRTRLDDLLPILRCPQTRQKLAFNQSRTALVSVDGLRSWPILEGRALLSPDLLAPDIKPGDHISNELPDPAVDLIRSTEGLVLNLSAGGSRHRFENVVEMEYAIFRHTDIVADAHELPFDDEAFEAVVVMNAFEHYRQPHKVAAELHRILKPNGRILIRTAFLQPLHERPWHFFNCTRYGLAEWFKAFETEVLHVSENFCPNHSIAWLASESEAALRSDVSAAAAEAFNAAPVGALVDVWRDPSRRTTPLWTDFNKLSQTSQEVTAAGFEFLGRKPADLPDLQGNGPAPG